MHRTEATRLCLCVDLRWLLMMCSIVGNRPCQASRHTFVSTWVRHFYKWCMPRCLIYSDTLITGPCVVLFSFFESKEVTYARQGCRRPIWAVGSSPRAS
jgi:hypothetical protein